MEKSIYTKKELKEIRKTLDIVLDELEKIWNTGLLKKVKIPVTLEGIKEFDSNNLEFGWYFIMDDSGIYMHNDHKEGLDFYYARILYNGTLKRYYNVDEREIMFFKEYDYIKNEIEKELELINNKKKEDLSILKKIQRSHRKAFIELSFPPSINQHTIEVTEENGKKIGTIDFGNMAIRIITDGDVRLIERPKDIPKFKRK